MEIEAGYAHVFRSAAVIVRAKIIPACAPSGASSVVATTERNRRRSRAYVEDFATEEQPQAACQWDAKMGSYFCAGPKCFEAAQNSFHEAHQSSRRVRFSRGRPTACCGKTGSLENYNWNKTLSTTALHKLRNPGDEKACSDRCETPKSLTGGPRAAPANILRVAVAEIQRPRCDLSAVTRPRCKATEDPCWKCGIGLGAAWGKGSDKTSNTEVRYLYRDAGNNKNCQSVVITNPGGITPEQLEQAIRSR